MKILTTSTSKRKIVEILRRSAKAVFGIAALASCVCVAAQSAIVLTHQEKNLEDKKLQVLDFLGRLKVALDLNVIGDPQRLQAVTGFEVLEWDSMLGNLSHKVANRWRYNVPVMDQAEEMLVVTQLYRTGYRAADNTPYAGGMDIGGFPVVACITPANADRIFGKAHLDARMKARPLHGLPWVAPFWDVNSYILNPVTGSLLTLTYHYEDEKSPRATCLKQLGIRFGVKPPVGY
ncbi:hypothetical protein [Polaromonas sp.]|uniref:hypothetical protein n=1 Tax=Polaromonas sp. TaxID=1869339 RepID=UPI003C9B6EAC